MMINRSFHILLVEDSAMITDRLQAFFSDLDFISSIDNAVSYTDAIDLLKKKDYRIVIVDINIGNETGFVLLETLQRAHPNARPIIFTNQVNNYYRDFCKKYGYYAFMDKSKDFEKLPVAIKEIYEKDQL